MPRKNSAVKNILVVRNDRFGEFLLNIPSLRALRETFNTAKIIIVVSPQVRELAESVPFVDEVMVWGSRKHAFSEKLRLAGILRKKKLDMAIMLNPSRQFNILAFLAGIPVRVGYDRKWGFLLTKKIEDKKHLGERHEIEYNLELVGLVGARTDEFSLSLNLDENKANRLAATFGIGTSDGFIALHPWTSDPIKQWPQENFQILAERLAREQKQKVLVIGGKDELSKGAEAYNHLGENVINMTGKTTLLELAGLLKKSKLLISGDSGPVHLACAVETPVIALFRNDIPGKSAKRWGPRQKDSLVIEKGNLSEITVEEVLGKTKQILGEK